MTDINIDDILTRHPTLWTDDEKAFVQSKTAALHGQSAVKMAPTDRKFLYRLYTSFFVTHPDPRKRAIGLAVIRGGLSTAQVGELMVEDCSPDAPLMQSYIMQSYIDPSLPEGVTWQKYPPLDLSWHRAITWHGAIWYGNDDPVLERALRDYMALRGLDAGPLFTQRATSPHGQRVAIRENAASEILRTASRALGIWGTHKLQYARLRG